MTKSNFSLIAFASCVFASSVDSTSPGVMITFLPSYPLQIFTASNIPSRFPLKLSSTITLPPALISCRRCSTGSSLSKAILISSIVIPSSKATKITAVKLIALKLPSSGAWKCSCFPLISKSNQIPSRLLMVIFKLFGNFCIVSYFKMGTVS